MTIEDDDPRELKRRNSELERKLADKEALLQLFIALPKPKSEPSVPEAPTSVTKTRARRAGAKAEAGGGHVPEQPSPQAQGRRSIRPSQYPAPGAQNSHSG